MNATHQDPQAPKAIAALLLAAGESRRMGQPKQLLNWQGQPLVRHVAGTVLASGAASLLVVIGSRGDEVAAALEGLALRLVWNHDYRSGQASSLRAGIGALDQEADGALIVLVDQPLIRPQLLDALIGIRRASRAPLVVPRYRGQRGNPVLIGRELWPELEAIGGDSGARALFERYRQSIAWLDADEGVVTDLDDPAAYAALLAREP